MTQRLRILQWHSIRDAVLIPSLIDYIDGPCQIDAVT